jgi:D-threo-aldose 1-dehydrogenase
MKQSEALATLIRAADVDLIMLAGRYTLLEQGAADDLLPLAMDRGVGVVIAGVYNTGLLSSARPSVGAKYEYEDAPTELIARANAIADVCERHGISLPAAALAFPLLHPAVLSVVVGVRDASQVNSNVERYSTSIPADLWSDLREHHLLPDLTHLNA